MATVETNGVNFIDKSQCTELVRNLAQFGEWANGTRHRVDRLESNDLGHRRIQSAQKFTQMSRIVVAEDVTRNAAVANSLDHRRVIPGIRENVAA